MKNHEPFQDAPLPELLAAHADGELTGREVDRVQAWLAMHPAGQADLIVQKRLGWRQSRLWQATAAENPPAHVWATALTRIELDLRNPKPMPAEPRPLQTSRRRLLAAIGVTAAAAILLTFAIPALMGPSNGPAVVPADEFVVATSDDVEILRIFEADADSLVVGELPLRRPLVLAGVDEVEGLVVVKDVDGMMPKIAMVPGPNSPMIVAPMAGK